MSQKCNDLDSFSCLHVSEPQNSNSESFDLIAESSTKFGLGNANPSITDLLQRENGVGETCDETVVTNHERSFSNPISVRERPVSSNSSYFRNHPRCCGDDEIVCFDDSVAPFKSDSPTTCLRWTEGLNSLLEDAEGLELFRQFLESEPSGNSKALDFVFSCRGFRLMNESDRGKLVEVARLIHKRYVLKETGPRLDPEIKRRVTENIKKLINFSGESKTDFFVKDVFAESAREAEKFLEKEMYPLFLKSDVFLDYFQKESEMIFNNNDDDRRANHVDETEDSPAVPHRSSEGRNDEEDEEWAAGRRKPPPSPKLEESHPVIFGTTLPSLPEEKELELPPDSEETPERNSSDRPRAPKRSGNGQSASVLQLSSLSLLATRRMRQKQIEFLPANATSYSHGGSSSGKLSNPYHVSYAPGSAQDSELQSLSSDAPTEDTMSFTDSSLDGRLDMHATRPLSMAAYKKHVRYVRNFAAKNQEANFPGRFIPRTECMPPDCNLATANPQAFASVLIGKLQVVKENQEKMERIVRIMQGLENTESSMPIRESPIHHHHHYHQQRNHHGRSKSKQGYGCHSNNKYNLPSLLPLEVSQCPGDDSEDPDNAQSILDDHVSHLWNSFGNSPNHFTSGMATPDGQKVKADSSRPSHRPHCLSSVNPCSNYSNFGQWCRETTNFSQKNLHQCYSQDQRVVPPSGFVHFDKGFNINQNRGTSSCIAMVSNGGGPPVAASSQKHRMSVEKYPARALTTNHCHPAMTSISKEGLHLQYGDAFQNTNSLSSFLGTSSCKPNSCSVVGQVKHRHQHPILPGKTSLASAKENAERSTGSKIPSNQSAFGKHATLVHRKQLSLMNSSSESSAMPSDSICGKSRRPIKRQDLLKEQLEVCQAKASTNTCKANPHPLENVTGSNKTNGQVPRSKSLDRNKVNSTATKFSHAVQNSAFMECRPDLMRIEGQSKASREALKHSSSKLPPPPKVKAPLYPSSQPIQGTTPVLQSFRKPVASPESTVVGYYMQNEPIPYRITLPGKDITLGQLKIAISKRDNYRFFFKKVCSDFDTDVVHEEVSSDNQVLPFWEGKIVCRVERTD